MLCFPQSQWRIHVKLEEQDDVKEIMVEPNISPLDLFERIEECLKEKLGSESALKLEQYDTDYADFVLVDSDDVEPMDEAEFRVVCTYFSFNVHA